MKNKKISPEIRERIFELYDSDLHLKIKTIACEVGYSEKAVHNTLKAGYTSSIFKSFNNAPPAFIPPRRDRQSRTTVRSNDPRYYDQPTSPSPDPRLISENNRLQLENYRLKRELSRVTSEWDAANRKVTDLTRTQSSTNAELTFVKSINELQKDQIERLKTKVTKEESEKNRIDTFCDSQLNFKNKIIKVLLGRVEWLVDEKEKWIKFAIPMTYETISNNQKNYIAFTKS